MKKFFELLFNRFWVNFALMMGIAILDLIGLTSKLNFGIGFVIAFLYFAGWVVYQMTKRDGEDKPV